MHVQYSEEKSYAGWDKEDKGIQLTSDIPLSVVVVKHSYKMGSYLAKSSSTLGTVYFAVTGDINKVISGADKNYASQVITVSLLDNKEITVTLSDGSQVNETLDSLQTATYSQVLNLSGTKIQAKKQFALVSASVCADNIGSNNCGTEAEMMTPVPGYVTNFHLVSFQSKFPTNVRLVAAFDNTQITLDGTYLHTMNTGNAYKVTLKNTFAGLLSSTKPITVAEQAVGSGKRGTPFTVGWLSKDQYMSGSCMFSTLIPAEIEPVQFLNIVTKGNIEKSMYLDSTQIDSQWYPITDTNFFYTRTSITPGNHTISCKKPEGNFTAIIYGFGGSFNAYGGYGYVCGMNFPHIETTTTTTTTTATATKTSSTATTPTPDPNLTTTTTGPATSTMTSTTQAPIPVTPNAQNFNCMGKKNGLNPDPNNPCASYVFNCFSNSTFAFHCPNDMLQSSPDDMFTTIANSRMHMYRKIVLSLILLSIAMYTGYSMQGPHQKGPHIASVTLAAYECDSLKFPEPPYPDEIVCPYGDTNGSLGNATASQVQGIIPKLRQILKHHLSKLSSKKEYVYHPQESLGAAAGTLVGGLATSAVSLWSIMGKVRLEAFMWGTGTALGELPPYFMAKAARLSGEEPDSEEYREFKQFMEALEEHRGVSRETSWLDRAKLYMEKFIQSVGFLGILVCASIPNPLFDLAGITCGHFLVPFWTFFGATVIGKAVVKMHIQKLFVIMTFSEKHVEKMVNMIKYVPKIGSSLQAPFKEYLKNQKTKLHRKRGEHVPAKTSKLQTVFECIVAVMVVYFLISIVNSLAQSYHKRICARELEKKK